MTDADRDRIRKLQDRILELPHIRRFISIYGLDEPLWIDGPTAGDLQRAVYPHLESDFWYVLEQ